MESKVSFSLRATSKRKRRRHGASEQGGQLMGAVATGECSGAFLSAEDVAREAALSAEQATPPKKRAMLLEDEQAKVKRLQVEGNTLAEAGRFRAAMDRWHEAVAVDPRNAVVYELLAQAAMAVCDDFDAVQFALKATQLSPSWGEAYHTLARCHLNFGELHLALENVKKAEELVGINDELAADRREIEELLDRQREIVERREVEAKAVTDTDRLQVISCLKHLSLRGQVS